MGSQYFVENLGFGRVGQGGEWGCGCIEHLSPTSPEPVFGPSFSQPQTSPEPGFAKPCQAPAELS